MVRVLFLADAPFAAVAADILTSAGETVDGETAVVGAALAVSCLRRVLQRFDLLDRQHGRLLSLAAVPGDQCGAEGTHDTCDIRAHSLAVRDALKAAENAVIIEGSALHNDVFSEFFGIGDLDDLVECVADDGVGEAGGDIGDSCALLLCLLYSGVHENGAARAEVYRVLGEKRLLGEILYLVAEGIRKVLNEGSAA